MDSSVIVAGAGPTGLMLAGELRLAGVGVTVLERLGERTGQSRGLDVTARTMEILDQRGLLQEFGPVESNDEGHFGGVPVDFRSLQGAHQAANTIPQPVTEAVLEKWAAGLGADIRRGYEVLSTSEDADGVEVTASGPEGVRTLRSRWLVGCDGGRSTIREAGGFEFAGTSSTLEMFLADIRRVDIEPRMIGEVSADGMVMATPPRGGVTRIIVCERGNPPKQRTGPPEFQEVAAAWKRLTGIDISHAEPVWISAFGDAARQATEYRRGRLFLAGDAAHIHLPAGGQGMNAGIQDAVNLGWKLGAVVRGDAPVRILDTYHEERHPVGERLLINTRAQGALFLGGAQMRPLRSVFSELVRYAEVNRYFAAMISGLGIRYDAGGGDHPLLGRRMPKMDLDVRGNRRSSAELQRTGRWVLLDLVDDPNLRRRTAGWRNLVDVVTANADSAAVAGTRAVLLRPDGYVAWAHPGSYGELPTTLNRWFGSPVHPDEEKSTCTAP